MIPWSSYSHSLPKRPFSEKKPVWATCPIGWGWCGFHRTSCHPVCYIPVNHIVCSLRYFQTPIAIFLVIFNGFEVICWLLVGHDILWDCCDMTWNWSSRCLAMPSFPAAFSPLCRCWKYTNKQIYKYTNTQIHKYKNTKFNETPSLPSLPGFRC